MLLVVSIVGKACAVAVGLTSPLTYAALWFVPDFIILYHLLSPSAKGYMIMYSRFETPRREVWLTIDDGPDPVDTPRILALLARHNAVATFFMVGEHAAAEPELVRAALAAGHEVANHTHTHPLGTFWCASPKRLDRELDRCTAVLVAAGATPVRFRPPAGLKNPWLRRALQARRMTCIGWTVRGLEKNQHRPERVAERILRRVRPGAILLLHEGPRLHPDVRVRAIELVLERLSAEGYRCVVPAPGQLVA